MHNAILCKPEKFIVSPVLRLFVVQLRLLRHFPELCQA